MFICNKLNYTFKMFGRISEVLQSAADVLAPPPSPLQDFMYHWKIIKQFYNIERHLPKVHLNDTNIPYHLEQMLQILIKEEKEILEKILIYNKVNLEVKEKNTIVPDTSDELSSSSSILGECMEFLLGYNLLEVLVELGISDTPPGARLNIIYWTRRFLSCLQNPPISHSNIFQPIQKLVNLCNGKCGSPYETEEILLLVTVAGLVRKNANLIHLFLPYHQHSAFVTKYIIKKNKNLSKIPNKNPLFESSKIESNVKRISIIHDDCKIEESNNENSVEKKIVEENEIEQFICDCDEGERLYLLDAIISYFESADCIVIVRACEAALILASLSLNDIDCSAVQSSYKTLSTIVIDKIIYLCQRIPEDMDLGDIDDANVSWGLIPRDTEMEHFIGRHQLFEFLCWLDYLDCLARECSSLEIYLGKSLRQNLLEDIIEPAMLDINAAFTTILAAKIIRQFHSKFLQNEIANWLVGDKTINEINGSDTFLKIIIENAQDNHDLIFQTLQFIEALLDLPNERVLHGMIFFYINNRGYFDTEAQRLQSWSDEEDEREKRRGSADGPIKSRTLAPSNILKVINNFLLLLPRQIVGEGGGTCYEEYVQDASRHYQIWIKKTEHFDWPNEAIFSDYLERSPSESVSPSTSLGLTKNVEPNVSNLINTIKTDSQCNDSGISEEVFYEGPLLRMLFNHVKNMASQQYELNLAVIAILSKLALFPHPYLHEILLSPEIPVAPGATTLWSAMQVLAKQLLIEIPRLEGFPEKIAETGKKLLANPPILTDDDDDNEPLIEAITVLEEFCKELAAIAFVKYHHATE